MGITDSVSHFADKLRGRLAKKRRASKRQRESRIAILTLLVSMVALSVLGLRGQASSGGAWFPAQASEAGARCYRFNSFNMPAADYAAQSKAPQKQLWCYQTVAGDQGTLIFRADTKEAKAELSALVHPDGSVTFGSRLRGETSVVKIPKGYNPLPVPLEEPLALASAEFAPTSTFAESTHEVLDIFRRPSESIGTFAVEEGYQASSVPKRLMPWRGYWFPYSSGRLHAKRAGSPLGKYDRYVEAKTGTNPGALQWESFYHNGGEGWYGHCNGWAASSVLEKEPRTPRFDPRSGVRFEVSDQKGMLIEKDMCVAFKMFGHRFEATDPESALWDINPDLFHKAVIANLGFVKKPMLLDYDRGVPVFNAVATGYKMTIKKLSDTSFDVVTELETHDFDNDLTDLVGEAPAKKRIYKYVLYTDREGNITSGTWRTTNPDFVWIPLSTERCAGSNPSLDTATVYEIINNLPEAPAGPNPAPTPVDPPPRTSPPPVPSTPTPAPAPSATPIATPAPTPPDSQPSPQPAPQPPEPAPAAVGR